ncbi:MAG: hypothetical protein KJ905_04090 [Nanoarchaeota archaeon]|nr:hypothetical protein [Nanoarchaeota archaeon]MBU1501921.1 hypothetical protein [Nanoarchaeota archaeon]MBU2459342.1 hypothetical protein [Nanoarchaeota archaeon]
MKTKNWVSRKWPSLLLAVSLSAAYVLPHCNPEKGNIPLFKNKSVQVANYSLRDLDGDRIVDLIYDKMGRDLIAFNPHTSRAFLDSLYFEDYNSVSMSSNTLKIANELERLSASLDSSLASDLKHSLSNRK